MCATTNHWNEGRKRRSDFVLPFPLLSYHFDHYDHVCYSMCQVARVAGVAAPCEGRISMLVHHWPQTPASSSDAALSHTNCQCPVRRRHDRPEFGISSGSCILLMRRVILFGSCCIHVVQTPVAVTLPTTGCARLIVADACRLRKHFAGLGLDSVPFDVPCRRRL